MNTGFKIEKRFIGFILITLSLIVTASCKDSREVSDSSTPAVKDKPNILFIYTDDQAPWALGYSGNKTALTPNIDNLARQGMYFPNAYTTTPVCSPSRAGLLTSRYGYELGIDDWINTHLDFIAMQGLEPNLGLDPSLPTWPKLLKQNGYKTGLVGKWHLGSLPQYHPTNYGYDQFNGFIEGGTTPINPVLEINGQKIETEGFTADVLTKYALSFIQEHKSSPFLLSLHYRAPHTAWLPVAEEDSAPYQSYEQISIPNPDYPNLNTQKVKRFMAEYLSSVRSIDRNLGVILKELDALNLSDNTIVIFTSDHGYTMGHNGIWHKGNGHWILNTPVTNENTNIPTDQRPNLYDNSIKVPLIVRWPNKIKAGSTNQSSFSNLDWFPTIAALTGSDIGESTNLRGMNMDAALYAADTTLTTDYYAAYSTKHQSISGMRMYSDGKFKLVRDFVNASRDEFYNLEIDPEESNNLIATEQAIFALSEKTKKRIQFLNQTLIKKMRQTDDPLAKSKNFEENLSF